MCKTLDNVLVKFYDVKKADELVKLGFTYVIDNSGNIPQYSFVFSDDIAKLLMSKFDSNDYYFTNRLNFCSCNTTGKGV